MKRVSPSSSWGKIPDGLVKWSRFVFALRCGRSMVLNSRSKCDTQFAAVIRSKPSTTRHPGRDDSFAINSHRPKIGDFQKYSLMTANMMESLGHVRVFAAPLAASPSNCVRRSLRRHPKRPRLPDLPDESVE